MAYHSNFKADLLVGNMGMLPLKTDFKGPAPSKKIEIKKLSEKNNFWKGWTYEKAISFRKIVLNI